MCCHSDPLKVIGWGGVGGGQSEIRDRLESKSPFFGFDFWGFGACILDWDVDLGLSIINDFSFTESSFYGTDVQLQRSHHQLRPYCRLRISLKQVKF